LEAVNLIDEENAAARHRREQSGKIACLLDRGAAGGTHLGIHGVA
jgi:hypothetical protein